MSNLDYRYEIIGAFNGGGYDMVEHAATKEQAFRIAVGYLKHLLTRDGDYDHMAVYDLLAHKRAVSEWHVYRNGEIYEVA